MYCKVKSKKTATHPAVRRNKLDNKSLKALQNHYQVNGRLFGHWADDWLTDWQRKNEG